ncbi:hypothetical protein ACO1PF_02890 [Alkalibacterium sp. f15]|uniref:hypothetical protein n=1 Tax=Alkalibacterium sp. f15 TaxID=3414029 RepID=UPI003BF7CB4D
MDRVALLILVLMTGGAAISFLLSKFFNKKWVWYVPSMIGVLVITYVTFRIETENMEGFEELGYVILTLMVATFMIGNLLTNVIIYLRRRKKNGMSKEIQKKRHKDGI